MLEVGIFGLGRLGSNVHNPGWSRQWSVSNLPLIVSVGQPAIPFSALCLRQMVDNLTHYGVLDQNPIRIKIML
jgi:hypothetical protein